MRKFLTWNFVEIHRITESLRPKVCLVSMGVKIVESYSGANDKTKRGANLKS